MSSLIFIKKISLPENINLDPATEDCLFKLLKNFQVTKVTETDEISGKCLKDGGWILAKPICELCKFSVTLGSFPDTCKITKVKPLFKKG